jgi:hypothetical protein
MRKGEKAILRCSPEYAYGAAGSPPVIPANATLNFDVELVKFAVPEKPKHQMSPEEKVAKATTCKDEGTELFKEKRFDEAIDSYETAADWVDHVQEGETIWITCKLNAAQCAINL